LIILNVKVDIQPLIDNPSTNSKIEVPHSVNNLSKNVKGKVPPPVDNPSDKMSKAKLLLEFIILLLITSREELLAWVQDEERKLGFTLVIEKAKIFFYYPSYENNYPHYHTFKIIVQYVLL
jgi:hypothetical protein